MFQVSTNSDLVGISATVTATATATVSAPAIPAGVLGKTPALPALNMVEALVPVAVPGL